MHSKKQFQQTHATKSLVSFVYIYDMSAEVEVEYRVKRYAAEIQEIKYTLTILSVQKKLIHTKSVSCNCCHTREYLFKDFCFPGKVRFNYSWDTYRKVSLKNIHNKNDQSYGK